MPAWFTALPLSPAERSSSRSRCSSRAAMKPADARRIACLCSRSSTCSSCLRPSWSTTAAVRRHPFARGAPLRLASDLCDPISDPVSSQHHPVPPQPTLTRSDMRYCLLLSVLIGAAALGGCTDGVLDPKGPIAAAERQILFNSLGIMLAIVIPTILATLGAAYWFRASNKRATYRPDFAESGRLELLVWSIPAMTVLLVGGVAWVGAHHLDPRKPIVSAVNPVSVQVVSLDWKWLFIYPEQGIASVNRLTVPVGTPISFDLTASGVMNSFSVPQLGGQIYTMAGMVTRLHLLADHTETYRGMSANYSGDG